MVTRSSCGSIGGRRAQAVNGYLDISVEIRVHDHACSILSITAAQPGLVVEELVESAVESCRQE